MHCVHKMMCLYPISSFVNMIEGREIDRILQLTGQLIKGRHDAEHYVTDGNLESSELVARNLYTRRWTRLMEGPLMGPRD